MSALNLTQNVLAFDKAYEAAQEVRAAERDARCEPACRYALMDALVMQRSEDKAICAAFLGYMNDECVDFNAEIFSPSELSLQEILDKWRLRWVNAQLDEYGWQMLDRMYDLGCEDNE